MLTKSSIPLTTALLADGYLADYLQFLIGGGDGRDVFGAPPIGEGLQGWLKNSPGFNLDKTTGPLLIATERDGLDMWQPYAVLHYLKKPVDLVMLNTDEHVITNPVERLASQGLSVDWFRFWLQGYEDPDPAKADQYERWRELKNLQAENERK